MQNEEADPAKAEGADRRGDARRRSLKGGRIIYGNLSMSMDCMIRNLSANGAKLDFADSLTVPGEFYLFVTGDHLIARATVAWRTRLAVGVRFLEPLVHPRQHPDPRIGHLHLY